MKCARGHFVQSVLVAVSAALMVLIFDVAGASAQGKEMPGEELVRRLTEGQDLDLDGFVIKGDVDLKIAHSVVRPFRCVGCTFTGAVRARDVVFERPVDLSTADIEGEVDLSGALFKDPVTFADADLTSSASFRSARFLQKVSFAATEFTMPATFDHAVFSAGASFVGGLGEEDEPQRSFRSEASFRHAEWGGDSDFGQRHFDGPASFEEATFGGRVSFTSALFNNQADFKGCVLRAGGEFRGVQFIAPASFQWCRAGGPIDFEGATFEAEAKFQRLATSSSLSLTGVIPPGGTAELYFDKISVADLMMDVELVDHVHAARARERLLAKLESSAQTRGDLTAANDARYRLLSSRSSNAKGLDLLFDRMFYRAIGGYLVRPLHPLATFGVLLLIGGGARAGAALWSAPVGWLRRRLPSDDTPRSLRIVLGEVVLSSQKVALTFLRGFAAAFGTASRRKPEIALDDAERISSYFAAGIRWLEYLGYKLLLAVFVLTLGNSNTTFRQLFDALRG